MTSTSNDISTNQPPANFDSPAAVRQTANPIGRTHERRPPQAHTRSARIEAPSGAVGEAALAELLDRDNELRHHLLRKRWRLGHRPC